MLENSPLNVEKLEAVQEVRQACPLSPLFSIQGLKQQGGRVQLKRYKQEKAKSNYLYL